MTNEERIIIVRRSIDDKTDYSLIEKLELVNDFRSKVEFDNFVLVVLTLIEFSKWRESASSILIRKFYELNIFKKTFSDQEYGAMLIQTIRKLASAPYTGISTTLRRIISSIIYNEAGTVNITRITSKQELIATNEFYLAKYLDGQGIDNDAMELFYNCIESISSDSLHITLSKGAITIIRKNIQKWGMFSYLRIFLRPLFVSASRNFPGEFLHVPEPFYLQIFGTDDEFKKLLDEVLQSSTSDEDANLVKEIIKFMGLYLNLAKRKQKGVDIMESGNFSRNLHLNARFLER